MSAGNIGKKDVFRPAGYAVSIRSLEPDAMPWGHRLKKLTKREKDVCRLLEWSCGVASCHESVEYISTYSVASAHGHALHKKRPFCPPHARQFAMRNTLAWPTRDGKVRIRLPPLRALSAAKAGRAA
jgi:hypothetical protein